MTEPVLGSSLLQAQDDHSSHHNNNNHHNHIRSHRHERLHRRQADSSDTIVQIVQTVSVVQLIDASGATIGANTQTSEPSTTAYAVVPTVGIESTPDLTSAVVDDVTSLLSTILDPTASSVDSATTSSMPSSFPTVESYAAVTSAPSSGSSSAFPTFAGVTNSTTVAPASSSLFSNGTASLKPFTANLTTSTLPSSAGTILFNDTFTTTVFGSSSGSFTLASTTGTATSTGTEDGGSVTGFGFGGNGGTATGESSPSSTSTEDAGSGSSSGSASPGTVAGSVLGAVAGVGLILIAALMLLRYKKRQRGLRLSDGNAIPGTRGLMIGGGGPTSGGPGGMGEVSQRRSVPFAVPAALASLTGYKRYSDRTNASSEGPERGFQKVSGRKLPSVLQHGGDGYSDPTDPRNTMMSDQSFYRDSTGWWGGPDMPRVAVGSPMRPESGIPVFHPGPARTPVTESGHFSDTLEPPAMRDPLGRSHPSQDGSNRSHGSGSRFTEEI
ncbi:hypothetical protein JX265_003988 [Neoarthrinium moseri]|uniref:Uncharacterized protein n=1 Tax=Neoarthrinium moseri TaxID=1658444 RepID=A0A9P9WRE1_9PEZI|nr:uncharacterized protein JN550_006741 [Neoarthrinium moseri]KAI1853678.1 hypothetical protein JX266_001662 [Neoarthrinium moseri]KAI1867934.1 hypothetical protein JN550_006741 [Neoarthrinium moseri]KAI1876462.1 hypothetical protein JX265_003988 [Neoarthrinium moseri]